MVLTLVFIQLPREEDPPKTMKHQLLRQETDPKKIAKENASNKEALKGKKKQTMKSKNKGIQKM